MTKIKPIKYEDAPKHTWYHEVSLIPNVLNDTIKITSFYDWTAVLRQWNNMVIEMYQIHSLESLDHVLTGGEEVNLDKGVYEGNHLPFIVPANASLRGQEERMTISQSFFKENETAQGLIDIAKRKRDERWLVWQRRVDALKRPFRVFQKPKPTRRTKRRVKKGKA